MKTGITTTIQIRLLQSLWLALCMPFLILASCGDGRRHARLKEISESLDAPPSGVTSRQDSIIRSALEELRDMPADSLPESDRHFRDLLLIKASDKAYMAHTSDSLILDVIGYYSRHPENPLYPEALYYGGRVYSDLGDYPTALRYLQDALEQAPGSSSLRLKGNIISQTGRLLNKLALYENAIPYIEDVIEINKESRDTLNLMYNLQLLGAIHLHCKRFEIANDYFTQAYDISRSSAPQDTPLMRMYLAAASHLSGDSFRAIRLIAGVPEKIEPICRNIALAYASEIYLSANKLDTAYMYAHQLASSKDPSNRITGYRIILLPSLRVFLPKDSIDYYYTKYKDEVDWDYSHHQSQATALQNAFYNYHQHDLKREKAERYNTRLEAWLFIAGAIILLSIIGLLWLKNVHQRTLLQLQATVINVKRLREELLKRDSLNSETNNPAIITKAVQKEETLQEEVRTEVLSLVEPLDEQAPLSSVIVESQAYHEMQGYIHDDRAIAESNPLWGKIEKVIYESSPQFNSRLSMLSGNNLRGKDRQIAFLIKCGVTPTQMASLLALSGGAITYRKYELSKRLFGQKLDLKALDKLIRLL